MEKAKCKNCTDKMIEEMAKVMCGNDCEECAKETAQWRGCSLKKAKAEECLIKKEAKLLYNAGYRNCKDKVVLTKEEKQKLLKEMYEQGKFDALADLEKDGKVVLSEGEYSDIIEDEVETLKRDIAEYWACSDIDVVTQELHKDGYRKLDDHAIITLRKAKGLEERARKQTAQEIAKELLNFINLCDDMEYSTYEKISNKIDEIAKQFGVEVEE